MSVVVSNFAFATGESNTPSCALSVSGSDRALWIGLKTVGGPTVSSPQVDGFALTEVLNNVGNDIYSYLYVAPTTGSRTVQFTLSGSHFWALCVASLTGVHQSSPIGTPLFNNNSEATSISQAVTGVADGLVMDFGFMANDAINPGAGQTRYPTSAPRGDSFNGGFFSVGMSAKGGSGAVTMEWAASASFGDNLIIACPFHPSAGGGGGASSNQNFLLLGVG